MTARQLRRHAAAAVIACLGLGGQTSCSSCGDVNCGSGLEVWWQDAAIPDGDVQLCVNQRCEIVPVQTVGNVRVVAPSSAVADKEVAVEMTILTASRAGATYNGSGRKRGDCCPYIALVAERDGRLVPTPVPSD